MKMFANFISMNVENQTIPVAVAIADHSGNHFYAEFVEFEEYVEQIKNSNGGSLLGGDAWTYYNYLKFKHIETDREFGNPFYSLTMDSNSGPYKRYTFEIKGRAHQIGFELGSWLTKMLRTYPNLQIPIMGNEETLNYLSPIVQLIDQTRIERYSMELYSPISAGQVDMLGYTVPNALVRSNYIKDFFQSSNEMQYQ